MILENMFNGFTLLWLLACVLGVFKVYLFLYFKLFTMLLSFYRGRKWNPLRERLDSYGYTVKQHIVGSLLFTPLLLLLPTTSVFYIFFTMISTLISSVSILIEIAISIIHATPYIKIFLWLVRRRRFPSGIWFEIMTCKSDTPDSQEVACLGNLGPPSEGLQGDNFPNRKASTVLVSTLRSNLLSIGEVLNLLFVQTLLLEAQAKQRHALARRWNDDDIDLWKYLHPLHCLSCLQPSICGTKFTFVLEHSYSPVT